MKTRGRRKRREHIERREDLKMKYDVLLVNVFTALLVRHISLNKQSDYFWAKTKEFSYYMVEI